MFQIRNTLVKWKDLNKSIFYDPKYNTKYHYKSIHSQFVRWCNDGIFKTAFYDCIPINNDDISITCFNNKDDNFFIINDNNDLFIDPTHINNKLSSENIINKKKVTKNSTISNIDGFIYSISNVECKNKNIKFNYKNNKIKTSIHDSKTILLSLKNINPNIKIKSITN